MQSSPTQHSSEHHLFQAIIAPQSIPEVISTPTLFLAGSIDEGQAEAWQSRVTLAVSHLPLTIFNPRRAPWPNEAQQHKDDPLFREQVEWELNALERASTILMYFAPTSKAPISLLEFGLFAQSGKLIVCCPAGFWRRGNVEIVCERYTIPCYSTLEKLLDHIISSF